MEKIINLARDYWKIRDSGDIGEKRSGAHNRLMDAMKAQGIFCFDREHYAQVAKAIVTLDDAGLKIQVKGEKGND